MEEKTKGFWSTGRLVIGVILLVLSLFILFQSCAAGVVNTLESSSDFGGTAGFFVAVFMIASGIIAICTRNRKSKAAPGVCSGLLALAAIVGFCNSAVYEDLVVWSVVNIALAIVFLICAIKTRRNA